MQQESIVQNNSIFLRILKACGRKGTLSHGKLVHDQIIRGGLRSDLAVGSTLIDMYAKCGSIREAQKVFDELPIRSVVTWNAMIAGYANAGQGGTAFKLFAQMKQEGIKPAKVTFLCILKGCASLGVIGLGNLIHDEIIRDRLESDMILGNTLVDMYGKCGHLQEAQKVFDKLAVQDVVSWNAIISGYAQHGHGDRALKLFNQMQQKGIKPDIVTFSCIFKACSSMGHLGQGQRIHEQLAKTGLFIDDVIGCSLVDMYAKLGRLDEAHRMFNELPSQNPVLWGTLIAGYARQEQYHPALELFGKMQREGIKPDIETFPHILKACAGLGALGKGKLIHADILRKGLGSDTAIGNALIDMYAKCSSLRDAHHVLNELPNRDVVSWNSIIAGYAEHGYGFTALELLEKMQQESIRPDKVTFLSTLKACGSVGPLGQGKKVHEKVIVSGLESDVLIGSTLVDMYAKWGNLEEAHEVFNKLPNKDVVSHGALISGYVQQGQGFLALKHFWKMLRDGIKPDHVTFACMLKACGSIEAIDQGKLIHGEILKNDSHVDMIIGNALIDMYAKCASIVDARIVFDVLPSKNVASWNCIMTGYAQHEDGVPALELFGKMQEEGMKPDRVTFLCILKACGSMGAIAYGKIIHEQIISRGFESDLVVGNTIVDMYAKCGNLEEARRAFHGLPDRDVVSWSAMIAGYAQHGNFGLAQQYLDDMHQEG